MWLWRCGWLGALICDVRLSARSGNRTNENSIAYNDASTRDLPWHKSGISPWRKRHTEEVGQRARSNDIGIEALLPA